MEKETLGNTLQLRHQIIGLENNDEAPASVAEVEPQASGLQHGASFEVVFLPCNLQALNFWFFCFKTKELVFVSFWQQKEKLL